MRSFIFKKASAAVMAAAMVFNGAVAGVSNALQAAIDGCVTGTTPATFVSGIRKTHEDICAELQSAVKGFNAKDVMSKIEPNFAELEKLLQVLQLSENVLNQFTAALWVWENFAVYQW